VSRPAPDVVVVTDERELGRWHEPWDALATQAERPYMTPAWTLAWWRHLRPPDALLRIVLVVEGDTLVGATPLFVRSSRRPVTYRMLGLPYDAPKQPLARPGDEERVAAATASALAAADPRADALELPGLPLESAWRPALLSAGEGAHTYEGSERAVPCVPLDGATYEAWFGAKSRNFRQQMRRARRHLEEQGGMVRLAEDAEEVGATIPDLIDLHEARWSSRGGSSVVRPGLAEMLRDATSDLGVPGRARLWLAEADGRTISAHLFVACGGRSSYWLGGFDDAWAAYHPGMLCLLAEIEHACGTGQRLVDLGAGDHPYKQRLATSEERIGRATFVFKGRGYAGRRLVTAPGELTAAVASRTPTSWKRALRQRGGGEPVTGPEGGSAADG
jgi:CelD/BcsL family acetyltransferase involved in cellulose biosynthesis